MKVPIQMNVFLLARLKIASEMTEQHQETPTEQTYKILTCYELSKFSNESHTNNSHMCKYMLKILNEKD